MAADAKRVSVVTAFGSIDGKLYFGPNHLQVSTQAFEDGAIDAEQVLSMTPENPTGKGTGMAFGWIFKLSDGTEEAEFYSDFLQKDQDFEIFDNVFAQLRKKFPKLVEMSMGPDQETLDDMKKHFDG